MKAIPSLRNHPLLKGVTLPDRLGSPNNRGGAMVTRSGLVFIGGGDGYLYAFDTKTGKEVWRGEDAVREHRQPDDLPHALGPPVHRRRDRRRRGQRAGGLRAGKRMIAAPVKR